MPGAFEIDTANEIVFGHVTGNLVEAELFTLQDALRSDPAFKPHFRQLIDFTAVTEADVSTEAVRRLAIGNPFGPGARRAFVAPLPLVFGLARMFEMLIEQGRDEVQVFRELPEARRWLGLDP